MLSSALFTQKDILFYSHFLSAQMNKTTINAQLEHDIHLTACQNPRHVRFFLIFSYIRVPRTLSRTYNTFVGKSPADTFVNKGGRCLLRSVIPRSFSKKEQKALYVQDVLIISNFGFSIEQNHHACPIMNVGHNIYLTVCQNARAKYSVISSSSHYVTYVQYFRLC